MVVPGKGFPREHEVGFGPRFVASGGVTGVCGGATRDLARSGGHEREIRARSAHQRLRKLAIGPAAAEVGGKSRLTRNQASLVDRPIELSLRHRAVRCGAGGLAAEVFLTVADGISAQAEVGGVVVAGCFSEVEAASTFDASTKMR